MGDIQDYPTIRVDRRIIVKMTQDEKKTTHPWIPEWNAKMDFCISSQPEIIDKIRCRCKCDITQQGPK